MQPISKDYSRWHQVRTKAGCTILALVVFALSGCATGGKSKPESSDQDLSQPQGPSVARLENGREGFVIRETAQLDAESVRNFERAIAKMKEEDYKEAAGLLEKVIENSPKVTAPYINLAVAYKHQDKLELAEQHLQTALELIPGHPVASNEYGLLLRKTGRFAKARTVYEKALARFPEYHPARKNLGILCDLYLNDLGCALEQYQLYSEAVPKDEQVDLWIADLRMRLGN